MSKNIRYLLIFVLFTIGSYLTFSFVNGSFDINTWSYSDRVHSVFYGEFLGFIVALFMYVNDNWRPDELI
jgi:hypothetical protein